MPHAGLYVLCIAVLSVHAQDKPNSILVPGRDWQLLGEGFHLTADSAVDGEGNVYFTDNRNDRIVKIGPDGKISDWKRGTNGAHGVAFGPDGRLYAGQHDRKTVAAFAKDGTESVISEGVQSHHLTVTPRNHIYLTVPPTQSVWLVEPNGNKRIVYKGMNWPRGIRASSTEALILVNDARGDSVWSFQIQADGSLVDRRQFCRLQTKDAKSQTDAGGMTFDSRGILYVATNIGVQVCDPRVGATTVMETPGTEGVSDVFFAGTGLRWLYVTDGSKMYRRSVSRSGVLPWRAP